MASGSQDSNPRTIDPAISADDEISRSVVHALCGVRVLGTGSFVPDSIVSNQDLAARGFDPEWIVQRTGVVERRCLPGHLATSDMAIEAARRCIDNSGAAPDEIDLVVLATITPDSPVPATACLIQDGLDLQAAAMDINAACAGFMYAMITAAQFVRTGVSRRVLVIGADTNTRIVNPRDTKTYPIFGDGAGAVLLGTGSNRQGFHAFTLGAEGAGAHMLGIRGGGSRTPLTRDNLSDGLQFVHMDGRPVFKWAVKLIVDTVHDLLRHASLELDEIKLIMLHQANLRIVSAAAEALAVDPSRMWVNINRYGNTTSASIPLCLDEAHRQGRIQRQDKLLLCGFGAGLAWGSCILEW